MQAIVELPTCDECGERPANVFFTKVDGQAITKSKLCEQCARETSLGDGFGPELLFEKIVEGFAHAGADPQAAPVPPPPPGTAEACAQCGLAYPEFVKGGRFGCEDCFAAFGPALPALLAEVQRGATEHCGRVPAAADERVSRRRLIHRLRDELQAAVTAEAYERAAELRDRLRELGEEATVTPHGQG